MANTVNDSEYAALKGDEKILQQAIDRFKLSEEAERDIRLEALDDLEFRAGKHWPDEIKNARQLSGRPCLVINKTPQFVQQVTNDQRQNRPSIKVHPVDDKTDVDTAKIIQGIIKHIEYNSNADVAYDTAYEGAVIGGRGFWRVITDYVDPMSFEQDILIKRILNPFSVFFDPHSKEPDGSDASYAFVVDDMSADEYRAKYPKSKLAEMSEWESLGNMPPLWAKKDTCRIAEYFYIDYESKAICLLNTGEVVLKSELEQMLAIKAMQGIEAQVVDERVAQIPIVRWCKLNGIEVLEKREWPGKYIPIVPVYGQELDINGKRILEGIVRHSKDPARMYDYWASAETEAIALAPRAPFVAAEGQIEDRIEEWQTANTHNHAVLRYKPQALGGALVPPPQRNSFEPAVQAITQARMLASDDLKATTGIYDAALGAKSNETSGVAIQRRNAQAQTSNFHLVDNLTRSLRHTGRIIIDIIPKIYDTPRAMRIIGEEGDQRIIKVNEPFSDNGKDVLYDVTTGKFDVAVDVGPSFATKRQEAAASMIDVSKAFPPIMQVAGDLLVKNMDWPGAQEISERLKKMLPPQLADDGKNKNQQIPPQVQAQMQQMSQMVEQLTAKLNEAQDEKEKKLIEIESKERIEMKKLEVQLEIERAKLDAKDALALLNAEIAQINQRMSLLRADQPIPFEESEQVSQPEPQEMLAEQDPTGGIAPGTPMDMNPEEFTQ